MVGVRSSDENSAQDWFTEKWTRHRWCWRWGYTVAALAVHMESRQGAVENGARMLCSSSSTSRSGPPNPMFSTWHVRPLLHREHALA